jgi:hypothetical protein
MTSGGQAYATTFDFYYSGRLELGYGYDFAQDSRGSELQLQVTGGPSMAWRSGRYHVTFDVGYIFIFDSFFDEEGEKQKTASHLGVLGMSTCFGLSPDIPICLGPLFDFLLGGEHGAFLWGVRTGLRLGVVILGIDIAYQWRSGPREWDAHGLEVSAYFDFGALIYALAAGAAG